MSGVNILVVMGLFGVRVIEHLGSIVGVMGWWASMSWQLRGCLG